MVLIPNHVQRAIALLAGQFQQSLVDGEYNRFQRLIRAFVTSMQEIDNVDQNLKFDRAIDTAVGVQLDGLGQILGLARLPDESDDDYREKLRFQIYINKGNATPEEVITVLKFLTKATKVRYHEYYPAAFQMDTDGQTFPNPPEMLVTAIQSVSPAAVQYTPITATYGVPLPFVFSGDPIVELLYVSPFETDPFDLRNLQVELTDLLAVNAGNVANPSFGGCFAEFGIPIVTTSAGQFAEVIMFNGSQPPIP
jgi:hypothetical protein